MSINILYLKTYYTSLKNMRKKQNAIKNKQDKFIEPNKMSRYRKNNN